MGLSPFIAPMKAVAGDLPRGPHGPDGDWVAELKWDGMRLQVATSATSIRLRSGSGRDITSSIPELARIGEAIGADVVLDGEAVVFDDDGPSFPRLQQRIHVDRPTAALLTAQPIVFIAFDLLRLGEHDLTALPLTERRRILTDLVEPTPAWRIPPMSDDPVELFSLAEQRSLEGIVAKRRSGPYRVGERSPDWLKIKVRPRQEFVVGGWVAGSNALAGTIGSLIVGVFDDGKLQCAGRVGSGLRDRDRAALLDTLVPIEHNPFTEPVPDFDKTPHWVQPTEVVEVEYGRWAPGGSLWHPTFRGWRTDKAATEVVREDRSGPVPPDLTDPVE